MRIALGRINATVGDFEGNLEAIRALVRRAEEEGAELLMVGEQALSGTPAGELLHHPDFLRRSRLSLERLALETSDSGLSLLVGVALQGEGGGPESVAALLRKGAIHEVAREPLEQGERSEQVGASACFDHGGILVGVTLSAFRGGREERVAAAARGGAKVIIDLGAVPFIAGKRREMETRQRELARLHGVTVSHCNLVGGNDSLIFDGAALAVDAEGRVLGKGQVFQEGIVTFDLQEGAPTTREWGSVEDVADVDFEEIAQALVLGIRDYVRKSGFEEVLIGLSGGLDSAVVAALATRALGKERVSAVALPSQFTSKMSLEDGEALAKNLGIRLECLSIERAMAFFHEELGELLPGGPKGLAAENLQARIRGDVLMTLSNQRGALVLTTGNKSELGVGYCTLYGDMCGSLAVLGDVWKTWVYGLARHLNTEGPCIPQRILDRPPSAELREDQKDQDTLPPYEELDRILQWGVMERQSAEEIARGGIDIDTVKRVLLLHLRSEYKRRQAAPMIRILSEEAEEPRLLPMAHGYTP